MGEEERQRKVFEATLRFMIKPKRNQMGLLEVVDKFDNKVIHRCKSATKAGVVIMQNQKSFEYICENLNITIEDGLNLSMQTFEKMLIEAKS